MVMTEDVQQAKRLVSEAIVGARSTIVGLSSFLHANPEVSFHETEAAREVERAVQKAGYATDRPIENLPTAVLGTLHGTGSVNSDVTVGILAEYDALEGVGHACGHNLMAAAGVGAAIGLAAVRERFAGEVRFLGAPAEERGAGKQVMIDHGLFDGVDAAMIAHPFDRSHLNIPVLALDDLKVTFRGRSAHASSAPWDGINALDAMVQLFSSIGLWRQHLPLGTRVHGVITDGGDAPNVIPDHTAALFMLRADRDAVLVNLQARFRDLAAAAALAHGCEVEVESTGTSKTMRSNVALEAIFETNARALGFEFEDPDLAALGSTDMGNVSHVVPSIHPYLQICDAGTAVHSAGFRDAAAGRRANETFIRGAIALAHTAIEVLMDETATARVRQDFAVHRPEFVNF